MVIFVDSTEELQSKVEDVKRFNNVEVDTHRQNYYCKCGESNAVYLVGERKMTFVKATEDVEFIIVDCKYCNNE